MRGLGLLSRASQATSEKRGFRSPLATFGGGHIHVPDRELRFTVCPFLREAGQGRGAAFLRGGATRKRLCSNKLSATSTMSSVRRLGAPPSSNTEQTSWLLFLEYLDGLEQDKATEAEFDGAR